MTKKICCVPDVDLVATGVRLKELRTSHNYSVTEIAFYADVTDKAVYAWERGSSVPSLSNLCGLKALYKLGHLEDLLVFTQLISDF